MLRLLTPLAVIALPTNAITTSNRLTPWASQLNAQSDPGALFITTQWFRVPAVRPANSTGSMSSLHGTAPRVEHLEFLDHPGFWWLMGSVVVLVAVGVIGLETGSYGCSSSSRVPEETQSPTHTPSSGSMGREASFYHENGDSLRLVFCVVMINVSMLLWGICQEFVTTTTRYKGGETPASLLLVLFNRITSSIFAALVLRILRKPLYFPGFRLSCLPAVSNCLSSWCQYSSLHFISFALQSTAKSAKLLPVIAIGSLRGKRYTLLDYAEVLVIVAGLLVFGTETDAKNQPLSVTEVGSILLLLYIFCDSCTPHLQDYAFKQYPEVDPLQATLAMCCAACLGTGMLLVFTGGVPESLHFLTHNPVALLHMLVLSLASTVSQYMMVYTVKYFGPTVLTIIVTTRQMVSVLISDFLFQHNMPTLAVLSAVMVLGAVMIRALRIVTARSSSSQLSLGAGVQPPVEAVSISLPGWTIPTTSAGPGSLFTGLGVYYPLMMCAIGIHVLHGFYGLTQEFLATHTFNGRIFEFPMFVIAVNHSFGAIFALLNLKLQRVPIFTPNLWRTALPAGADLLATYFQHKALYYIYFPVQTLLKTLKLIPVMLVGRLLKNRTYSWLDYLEGALISGLVAYFVWDFQLDSGGLAWNEANVAAMGLLMMLGYVISDSFLSNLEDHVYQATSLDPAHMLFGLELLSGIFAWASLLARGSLLMAVTFLREHSEASNYVMLQALASAAGAYTCTLTVRLFGPAVFTLLMMSRQVFSLMLSVVIFGHDVNKASCLCLVVVAFLILTSSLRRVTAQLLDPADNSKSGH